MREIVQMSKDRDHTKGFGEIRSISIVKEKDSDLKPWTVASGENAIFIILFCENEREIEIKHKTVAVQKKKRMLFSV